MISRRQKSIENRLQVFKALGEMFASSPYKAKKAVTAHLKSEQLLPASFEKRHGDLMLFFVCSFTADWHLRPPSMAQESEQSISVWVYNYKLRLYVVDIGERNLSFNYVSIPPVIAIDNKRRQDKTRSGNHWSNYDPASWQCLKWISNKHQHYNGYMCKSEFETHINNKCNNKKRQDTENKTCVQIQH